MSIRHSQSGQILAALKSGRRLSAVEALREFGCFRLAARIHELRRAGHDVRDETVADGGKRYAVYHLVMPQCVPQGDQLQLADFGRPNVAY